MNTKLVIMKAYLDMMISSKNEVTVGLTTPNEVIGEFINNNNLREEEGLINMLYEGDMQSAFDYVFVNLSQSTVDELGKIKTTLEDIHTTLCMSFFSGLDEYSFSIPRLEKIYQTFIVSNRKTLYSILMDYIRNKGLNGNTSEDIIVEEVGIFLGGDVYYDSIDADEIIKSSFGTLTNMNTQMFVTNLIKPLTESDKEDICNKMCTLVK